MIRLFSQKLILLNFTVMLEYILTKINLHCLVLTFKLLTEVGKNLQVEQAAHTGLLLG